MAVAHLSTRPHHDEVRRMRDLLRARVLGGQYLNAHLPSEAELMAAHHASRSVVREALRMLRAEGLVERTQGVGTISRSRVNDALMLEAHGGDVASAQRVFHEDLRPHVLDRRVVPMPEEAASALGIGTGESCLRLEYISLVRDEPVTLATNYLRYPEAEAVNRTPFVTEWYRLLSDAGVVAAKSTFVMGCAPADELVAPHLGISQGSPVMTLEQIIHDPNGRPFDWAFVVVRADRFRFVSCSTSEHPRTGAAIRPDTTDPRSMP